MKTYIYPSLYNPISNAPDLLRLRHKKSTVSQSQPWHHETSGGKKDLHTWNSIIPQLQHRLCSISINGPLGIGQYWAPFLVSDVRTTTENALKWGSAWSYNITTCTFDVRLYAHVHVSISIHIYMDAGLLCPMMCKPRVNIYTQSKTLYVWIEFSMSIRLVWTRYIVYNVSPQLWLDQKWAEGRIMITLFFIKQQEKILWHTRKVNSIIRSIFKETNCDCNSEKLCVSIYTIVIRRGFSKETTPSYVLYKEPGACT